MSMPLFELPGFADLHDGPDLRRMDTIDMNALVRGLRKADVVLAVFPDETFVILHGEATLQRIQDENRRATLAVMAVRVANSEQAHIVAATKVVIAEGSMIPRQIETTRRLLADSQGASHMQ